MQVTKSIVIAATAIACVLLEVHPPAWAQAGGAPWTLKHTSKPSPFEGLCIGRGCQRAEEEYAARLIKLCLYRDAKTAGLFTRGDWRSHVGDSANQPCPEVLYADPAKRTLFVVAPFLGNPGSFLPGRSHIHCTPGTPVRAEFNACASDFFVPYGANERYRIFEPALAWTAVKESKVLDALDQHLAAEAQKRQEQQRAEYLADFQVAHRSLVAIQQFEDKYRSNDPDGFIAQLADAKRTLRIEEYRERFNRMQSIKEIEQFIADYAGDDPDSKLPQAQARLTAAKQAEAQAARQKAEQAAADQQTKRAQELERQIVWCRQESDRAREVIDRENEIGRVSGFVNKTVLREAGEIIVMCNRQMPRSHEEYKRLGGRKAYGEIR